MMDPFWFTAPIADGTTTVPEQPQRLLPRTAANL
jgi:hypothetical protein